MVSSLNSGPLGSKYKIGCIKGCYANAYRLAEQHPAELTYAEGYALGCVIPTPHAWCVDRTGLVVDPTWQSGNGYIGVPLNNKYVNRTIMARGQYGVIDNWEEHYPLLTGKHTNWGIGC